jgi:3-deoxy-D-manno-octulosonate 8-phosphate phosphatase KdsC-like HAD superfamily phosphatase
MIFNNYTNNKALKIKAFLLDVDGVLTDVSIIYDNN